MAKENNLHDLLVGIGDAIRTKEGTTEEINPQDFQTRIENLPSGGGVDLKRIGYTQENNQAYNDYVENGLQYAEQIARDWTDDVSLINRYRQDENLIYFPQVSFENATSVQNFCSYSTNLLIFPNFPNNGQSKNMTGAFRNATSLMICGDVFGVSNVTNFFLGCQKLKSVGVVDVSNVFDFTNFFGGCIILESIKIKNYKQRNSAINASPNLSIASINYLIENAIGVDSGAEQRTLTLNANTKARWQDPNQNPQYEYYAAMAAEKLITIA